MKHTRNSGIKISINRNSCIKVKLEFLILCPFYINVNKDFTTDYH